VRTSNVASFFCPEDGNSRFLQNVGTVVFLDILNLEDGTDKLSRNVGDKRTYTAQQPKKAKISTAR
jgi:hypothetical protein